MPPALLRVLPLSQDASVKPFKKAADRLQGFRLFPCKAFIRGTPDRPTKWVPIGTLSRKRHTSERYGRPAWGLALALAVGGGRATGTFNLSRRREIINAQPAQSVRYGCCRKQMPVCCTKSSPRTHAQIPRSDRENSYMTWPPRSFRVKLRWRDCLYISGPSTRSARIVLVCAFQAQ